MSASTKCGHHLRQPFRIPGKNPLAVTVAPATAAPLMTAASSTAGRFGTNPAIPSWLAGAVTHRSASSAHPIAKRPMRVLIADALG
jgi:hypothetical protein